MATTTAATKRIAIIIGSTRTPRIGPSIAQLLHKNLTSHPSFASQTTQLDILDLATFNLPLFDEPVIPMQVRDASGYKYAHTQAWSRAVSSYSGFVFLTPQYNWSIPAALKNALDFLYNEWVGKPALLLTYGGRGGAKAEEHLRQIVGGLRMKAVEGTVGFALHGHEGALEGSAKGELFPTAQEGWKAELEKAGGLFGELVKMVEERERELAAKEEEEGEKKA